MKNIIPYRVKEENIKFYKVTQRAYFFGLSHFNLIFVLYWLGIKELALFNAIVSVPAFVAAIILNRMGKHKLAFSLAFFELYFHQVLGTYYLGWSSGSQYFLIYLAGLSFFNPTWRKSTFRIILLLISVTYCILFFCCQTGIYLLPDLFLEISYISIGISTIIAISILIHGYTRSVLLSENKLIYANKELKDKNEEIILQRDELDVSKKQIEKHNTHIISSIQYAKRIQEAVLPEDINLTELFPEHFILNKPRDIVSGDFYWLKQTSEYIYVAVADCTGHGVPGALMSMLGTAFLNEITGKGGDLTPSEILNQLRTKVIKSLKQRGEKGEAKDGMDISLIRINLNEGILMFAGAHNSLIQVRKSEDQEQPELIQLKGDRMPISIGRKNDSFSDKEIALQNNDVLYLFTDGYVDQFGEVSKNKYMMKNLKNYLRSIYQESLNKQKLLLEKNISDWKGNSQQTDDMLMLGLKFNDTLGEVELFN